jgi:hypothetical protein
MSDKITINLAKHMLQGFKNAKTLNSHIATTNRD